MALEELNAVLSQAPNHTDALYMQAVSLRYQGKTAQAFACLAHLKQITPEFGRVYQEEGYLYQRQGDKVKALKAFEQACQFNSTLTSSWEAQIELLTFFEAPATRIETAEMQFARIKALPKELLTVTNFIHEKRFAKADELCRHYLQKHPQDTDAMRLLAQIAEHFGVMDEAEFLLASALEFAPEKIQIRLDYVLILRKRQKLQMALEQAQILDTRIPENSMFQTQLGICQMQLGNYRAALEMFQKVHKVQIDNPAILTSMGHAHKTAGELEAGVQAYQAACQARPDYGEAYFSLSNLKTYTFSAQEMAVMRQQLADTQLSHRDHVHFCFALGKAYEDQKAYETAFGYYEQGNALKKRLMRYDADKMTEELQAQIDTCTPELFEKQSGKGFLAADPIFIVGLPRAGSTLQEQILASHSQVDGTQELGNILALAHRLRGRGPVDRVAQYPVCLHTLGAEQLYRFGEKFIEDTRVHRGTAAFFIDKMPNNFRHVGLIHLILPNAKIIDVRRHPMACCFSGYKQLFAEGQEFTYGLREIGQYYHDYVQLMDHWDRVLPGKVLRVQYEDIVSDLETQLRRVLDFLELPFESACLEFHKTRRAVRTPSSEQVRQPIFRSGLEQWRFFNPWLDPLKTALGPVLKRYPIELSP